MRSPGGRCRPPGRVTLAAPLLEAAFTRSCPSEYPSGHLRLLALTTRRLLLTCRAPLRNRTVPGVRGTRSRSAQAWSGLAPYLPDLVIRTDQATFIELSMGRADLASLVAVDRAHVTGDQGSV